MVTIRDVAKHAGVSIATVSTALNDSASVSDVTRRKVLAAVEMMGYAPNASAQNLRRGKRRLIGIVVADISNPHCFRLVRTIEKAADAANYSIIICNTDRDAGRERAALAQIVAQHVAGIVLTPVGRGAEYVELLEARNLPPIVTVDQKVPGLARDFVGVDNRTAVRTLTQYLLRLGHRRIAMIAGPVGIWTSEERLAAFVETMEENGMPVDPSLCATGNYSRDFAYEVTKRLMTRSDRPTALIGANNVTALGALQAILDLGFHCPADVSLVGIDDVPWGGLVRPRVTTVAQPIEEIAQVAATWLFERMSEDAGAQQPPRDMVFPVQFLPGKSCNDFRALELAH